MRENLNCTLTKKEHDNGFRCRSFNCGNCREYIASKYTECDHNRIDGNIRLYCRECEELKSQPEKIKKQ